MPERLNQSNRLHVGDRAKLSTLVEMMSRNQLIVLWLGSLATPDSSETEFNRELHGMAEFSRDDLLEIMDELPSDYVRGLVTRYQSTEAVRRFPL